MALPGEDLAREIADLVQRMGQSLNMCVLYGARHKVSRTSLENSFPVLRDFVTRHEQTHFGVDEGNLLVNGVPAPDTPLAANIASRLSGLNLLSFIVEPGFTLEEYERLMELMLRPPAGSDVAQSASDLMKSLRFEHLQVTKFTYQRVAEDESEPAQAATETLGAPPPPDLANVMAFLKGDPEADAERCSEDISQLASDSEKLAELILRSVEIRAVAANLADGDSLTDLVVGCVSKVVSLMTTGPATRTVKDRKQARKSLMLLEKALLQRLQELAGDQPAEAAEKLLADTADSLDMETLAAKYARNRRATEESAGKLRRLIDQRGDDEGQIEELRGKLLEQGLTPEGWQELIITRPAPDSEETEKSGDGAEQVRVLITLMARMEETVLRLKEAEPGKASPELKELVAETNREAERLARESERKIKALERALHGDTDRPALTGKALRQIIAEIAQELAQPLTVMTMAISLLEKSGASRFDANGNELLRMADEGSKRMAHLINCMIRIAGGSIVMHPDRTVLGTLYNTPDAASRPAPDA